MGSRRSTSSGAATGVLLLAVPAIAVGFGGGWLIDQINNKKAAQAAARVEGAVRGQLRRVCAIVEVEMPQLVRTHRVPNAATDGKRIFFNQAWFARLLDVHCCDEAECRTSIVAAVMAHEVGHMFHGHVRGGGQYAHPHDQELEADHFAGVILARLGLDTVDFEHVLREIAKFPTDSHPEALFRIDALRTGYHSVLYGWV
jgi:hypothetical protein